MTCYNSELPIGPPGPVGPQGPAGPPGSGSGVSLADTLLIGNDTGGTDINLNSEDAIVLGNNSKIQEGTINNGFGGGVSLICTNEKEQQWENGVRYLRVLNGDNVYAETLDDIDPSNFYDNTENWAIGSRYKNLVTGIEYICTDASTDNAEWQPLSGTGAAFTYSANITPQTGSTALSNYSVSNNVMTLGVALTNLAINFDPASSGAILAEIIVTMPNEFLTNADVTGAVSVTYYTNPLSTATPVFSFVKYNGGGNTVKIELKNYGGVSDDEYDISATFLISLQ